MITTTSNKEKDGKNDDCSFSIVIAYPSSVSALNKDRVFKDVDRNAFLYKKYSGTNKILSPGII